MFFVGLEVFDKVGVGGKVVDIFIVFLGVGKGLEFVLFWVVDYRFI